MSILIYDENHRQRFMMEQIVKQVGKDTEYDMDVYSCDNPEKALKHAGEDDVDTAFISVEDKLGRGFFLAKKLKKLNPEINLIPMAQEVKFGQEFIKLRVSGYILGERTKQKVMDELDNLRYSTTR